MYNCIVVIMMIVTGTLCTVEITGNMHVFIFCCLQWKTNNGGGKVGKPDLGS